jgi:hypothetical protein
VTRIVPAALIALATLAAARTAHAQFGAAAAFRIQAQDAGSERNDDRTGIDFRVLYDRPVGPRLGVRGEVAYTQMHYRRNDPGARFRVNENGVEVSAQARVPLQLPQGELYLLGGPVASFRAACGVDSAFDSNGRVACGEGDTYLTGWTAGLGVRGIGGARLDWIAEVRLLGNVTAAQGGSLVALSVGFQRRAPRD